MISPLIFRLLVYSQNNISEDKVVYEEPDVLGQVISLILPIGWPLLSLIALIMILKAEFKNPIDKLIWLIVSFIPIIGPILFLAIGRKQRKE